MDGTKQNKVDSPPGQAAPDESQKRQIFGWFGKILPTRFFEALKRDLGINENSCIFTLKVTVWLMIIQRLCPGGTLAAAVAELLQGNGRELLEPCRQVLEGNIPAGTGAYSQARQRVSVDAARCVTRRTFEELHRISPGNGLRDRLFVLDGSSIRLAHTPSLVVACPPARNQHGDSRWPIMRVGVMHHVVTGMAMAPEFGPMYGKKAVGEQGLSEKLIAGLPPLSILIGDRNFGVLPVVECALRHGHAVVVRLTQPRAKRLAGGDLSIGTDRKVLWKPSRDDLRAHAGLSADTCIEGRFTVVQVEAAKEILYLFTTLQERAEEVAELYKERWNIETDLRSLKEQMRLHTIPARSPELAATELSIAIAAYNLIRTVMGKAAKQYDIDPKRLSFSRSREMFWAFARNVPSVGSEQELERRWQVMLRSIAQCRLPKRKRPPAPRVVWRKPQGFPYRK